MVPGFISIVTLTLAVAASWAAGIAQTQPHEENAIGLAEIYALALANNEQVAISIEDQRQAHSFKKQVRSVLFPEISMDGSYFRQEKIVQEGLAGASFLIPQRRTFVLRFDQPIFSGFRDLYGLRQASSIVESSRERLQQARDDLFLDVAVAFYEVLRLQKEVTTFEESLVLQRERLREVQARQRVGLARRTDVLLSETQAAGDEAELLRARNSLEIARKRLDRVAGVSVEGTLRDDVPEPDRSLDPERLAAQALQTRADIRAARADLNASRSALDVVRGEYLPSVDVAANVYAYREGVQKPVTWDFQFNLSIPLFSGGLTRARAEQAASRMVQAELRLKQLERQSELDIRSAHLDLESADALVVALRKELDVADESYRLIQEEYRLGLADNLEVLTAYNFLQGSRLQLEKEKIRRKLLWIRLCHAVAVNPLEKEEVPQ